MTVDSRGGKVGNSGGPGVGCMMQDGGTDRVPIDRFQKVQQSPTTKARTKKKRVKQLSLATFMQQRSFLFHTRHTVNGHRVDCAKFLPLYECLHDKRGFSWRPVQIVLPLRCGLRGKV